MGRRRLNCIWGYKKPVSAYVSHGQRKRRTRERERERKRERVYGLQVYCLSASVLIKHPT